jgi:hypothetical protein
MGDVMFKIIIVLIFLTPLLGYASPTKQPSNYVYKYYAALDASDYKKAYSYLSNERKGVISEEEYIDYHLKHPYKNAFSQLIKYEVINENINGNKAIVKLKAKIPDDITKLILMKSASHLAVLALEGKDQLVLFFKRQFNELEAQKSVTYKYSEITINMIKENNQWKLAK